MKDRHSPGPSHRKIEIYSAHAGGAYWKSFTDLLELAGFQIATHYGTSDKEYRAPRGRLGTITLRLKMYVIYPLTVWFRLSYRPERRQSTKIVITSPFYLPAIAALAVRGQSPIINLVNDLFPDALVYSSMISRGGLLDRLLSRVTGYSIRHCQASVFLGNKLRSLAISRYGKPQVSSVIPVGSESSWFQQPPGDCPTNTTIRILYSGAMGHMHEIETLAKAIELGLPDGIFLQFHSFGFGYGKLRSRLLSTSDSFKEKVGLAGALDHTAWTTAMRSSPIALITLKPGAEGVSFPSKTFSSLMAGQAILAICSKESDLANLVQDLDCGWVVEPGDVEGLRRILQALSGLKEEIGRKRQNAYHLGHSKFSMQSILSLWAALFEQLATDEPLRDRAVVI